MTSQIVDENTALKKEIEQMRRPEPSEESELETSKESDTAKVADVTTIFKIRQVTECEISKSAKSLNTP